MPGIVDPSPWIAARLNELAEEFRPAIAGIKQELGQATNPSDRRRLKKKRRQLKLEYWRRRQKARATRMQRW